MLCNYIFCFRLGSSTISTYRDHLIWKALILFLWLYPLQKPQFWVRVCKVAKLLMSQDSKAWLRQCEPLPYSCTGRRVVPCTVHYSWIKSSYKIPAEQLCQKSSTPHWTLIKALVFSNNLLLPAGSLCSDSLPHGKHSARKAAWKTCTCYSKTC